MHVVGVRSGFNTLYGYTMASLQSDALKEPLKNLPAGILVKGLAIASCLAITV